MKIAFLVENTENLTAKNLMNALHVSGHEVHILPYFQNGKDECSIVSTETGLALLYAGNLVQPTDYDGALLWCWGTAALGRKYLSLFENNGVTVLNSTHHTEVTDSKINMARMLLKANVPMPETVCIDNYCAKTLPNDFQEFLTSPPYVFKPDYGTRGLGVQFAFSLEDIQHFAEQLNHMQSQQKFILQRFVGNPKKAISHYRALVIGNKVFPVAMKVTAPCALTVSNIFSGGEIEFIQATDSLKEMALMATKASGLSVAGVDIMKNEQPNKSHYLVLEVNDGPGTKTFEQAGFNVSTHIIDYFIHRLSLEHSKQDIC